MKTLPAFPPRAWTFEGGTGDRVGARLRLRRRVANLPFWTIAIPLRRRKSVLHVPPAPRCDPHSRCRRLFTMDGHATVPWPANRGVNEHER
jgi:hypothetical protein